jgi:hypothetical protein
MADHEAEVQDLIKELEEFEAMFASDGWKHLTAYVETQLNGVRNALVSEQPTNQVFVLQGRAHSLEWVLNLPRLVEVERMNLESDD